MHQTLKHTSIREHAWHWSVELILTIVLHFWLPIYLALQLRRKDHNHIAVIIPHEKKNQLQKNWNSTSWPTIQSSLKKQLMTASSSTRKELWESIPPWEPWRSPRSPRRDGSRSVLQRSGSRSPSVRGSGPEATTSGSNTAKSSNGWLMKRGSNWMGIDSRYEKAKSRFYLIKMDQKRQEWPKIVCPVFNCVLDFAWCRHISSTSMDIR